MISLKILELSLDMAIKLILRIIWQSHLEATDTNSRLSLITTKIKIKGTVLVSVDR